jgi:hypothetical protein
MARVHTTVNVSLNDAELERLFDYAHIKQMSTSGVMRQAFRLYDLVEKTPGLLEHIERTQRELLGPLSAPGAEVGRS